MKRQKIIFMVLIPSVVLFSLTGCLSTGNDNTLVDDADRNRDKLMTYEEYYDLVTNHTYASFYKIQASDSGKTVKQYSREEFNKMDSNQDGFVTNEEVKSYPFE